VKTFKTKVIAEIGNTHEGSVGIAFSMIDMAVASGADLVKFQFHLSEFESTAFEKFRTNNFKQDRTRKDYWDRVSFTLDQWKLIKDYCDAKGIEFLCSPFSYEAARFLSENNLVKRWKIGSGEVTNFQLLSYVFGTGLEVLISTGLANESDLTKLIEFIKKNYKINQMVLMHCVSQYPTPLKNSSINLINYYADKFKVRVGHSDHSGTIAAPFFALTYDIEFLEIHITPNKLFFGPDTSSSLAPDEFLKVTNFRDDLHLMKQSKLSRDQLFKMSKKTAYIFRKSIYWEASLKKGIKIKKSNIVVRKPWAEIDASELKSVIGKTLVRDVEAGFPVRKKDFCD
jgi:N,N'-diacetyllegionaminate synthase